MRTRFQQQMEELREKLLRMGGLAELAVDAPPRPIPSATYPLPARPRERESD